MTRVIIKIQSQFFIVFLDSLMSYIPQQEELIDIWSGGPSNKSKNTHASTTVKYFQHKTSIIVTRSYFAPSHNKAPVNSVGLC